MDEIFCIALIFGKYVRVDKVPFQKILFRNGGTVDEDMSRWELFPLPLGGGTRRPLNAGYEGQTVIGIASG